MTTTAAGPGIDRAPSTPVAVPARASFRGTVRGEWIKLLSLRSTWWVLAATVVLITGVSLAVAASLDAMAADPATAGGLATANGAEAVSGGFQLGMLTIAVLGALLITGEYSTGMIRSTLAAVPTRVPVLGAKAVVLAVVTVAVASVSIALTYVATMPLLSEHDLVPALDEARTWQVFGGTVYFLVAAALFALGVGTLLRSSAAAITVALTVLLLLPGVLSFIHLDWVQRLVDYLPLPASGAFLGETGTPCRRPALGSRRRPACWSWPPTRWFHSSPVRCRCAAGTPEAFCRLSPCARSTDGPGLSGSGG